MPGSEATSAPANTPTILVSDARAARRQPAAALGAGAAAVALGEKRLYVAPLRHVDMRRRRTGVGVGLASSMPFKRIESPCAARLPEPGVCAGELGDQLKGMFDRVVTGPMPARLLDLADRLEEAFQRGELFEAATAPRRRAS